MRFLIANSDYQAFLDRLYAEPTLGQAPYVEQMNRRSETLFGVADFYSSNLRALGHEAMDTYLNNVFVQAAWARENGLTGVADALLSSATDRRTLAPRLRRTANRLAGRVVSSRRDAALLTVFEAQVETQRPDVLLVQDVGLLDRELLIRLRPKVGALVAQLPWLVSAGAASGDPTRLLIYDLVVSSAQPTVVELAALGARAALHRLAFEPRVLAALGHTRPPHEVVFVGGLDGLHRRRVPLLEYVARHIDGLRIWAPSVDGIPSRSLLRERYMGQAFGREMYEILAAARITLNDQTPVAPYANSMRLFEATGVGTLLVTDRVPGLADIFDPGMEVLAYRSPEECVALLDSYLADEPARQRVASAGQRRTLEEHTYRQRMIELVELLNGIVS